MDQQIRLNEHLLPLRKRDLPQAGTRDKVRTLVKHPDHRQLIPCVSVNKAGTIVVEFDARHPDIGNKLTFSNMISDGIVQVGTRRL